MNDFATDMLMLAAVCAVLVGIYEVQAWRDRRMTRRLMRRVMDWEKEGK
jgi:hypothetical protein